MPPAASTLTNFRYDINGLRALAVAAVILYHFGLPGFGGGFAGVDVFFVISGFLMTGIVVGGLERQGTEFSLTAFYMARARRILPALIALGAALLVLGWLVLLPPDYKTLSGHVVSSLTFRSNITFLHESGYFDTVSHEKWLLHTWSLAVEWQFYLLLPLALLALWRWRPGRHPAMAAMSVCLLASLALSILATPRTPADAFYTLPMRSWEMLAGGMVCLMAHQWTPTISQRKWIEAVGLALIVGACLGFDATSQWPGWRALIPVAGAVAVLVAARPDSRWTGNPIAQWLGTRSYSLYLWHWPIVVALTYLEWQANPQAIVAGLALTLVLGDLSYRWVESPSRLQLGQMPVRWEVATLLVALMAVTLPATLVRRHDGVTGRLAPSIEASIQEGMNKNPRLAECHPAEGTTSPSCIFGGNHLRAIVVGDSHANAVVTAVAAAAPGPDGGVMEWTYSGCPTLFGVLPTPITGFTTAKYQCAGFINWVSEKLATVPKDVPVVIVNRTTSYAVGPNEPWEKGANANIPRVYFSRLHTTATPEFLSEFEQHLTDTACQLARDRRVYLVRPIPEMGVDVPKTARRMAWSQVDDVSISLADYHRRHAFAWAAQDAARKRCGVTILDPLPYLCPDGRCHGLKDGRPLYYDDDHLSEFGNKQLVPMFKEVFDRRTEPLAH